MKNNAKCKKASAEFEIAVFVDLSAPFTGIAFIGELLTVQYPPPAEKLARRFLEALPPHGV